MRVRWRYWRYLFSATAVVLLVRYVGAEELLALLTETHPGPLLLFLFGSALVPPLFGLQIGIALRMTGNAHPLRDSILAATTAWSVGTLTPARAGDLSLAVLLDPAVPHGQTVALLIADKICSIAALAALGFLSALILHLPYTPVLVAGVVAAITSVVLAFALTWTAEVPTAIQRLGERFKLSLPSDAYTALRSMARKPRLVAWFFAASIVRWTYICVVNLFIFKALAQTPGIGHVIAGTAIGRIVSMLPISVGGIGLKEPVQIPIYRDAGVTPEAVVAASVLGSACTLVVAALFPWISAARPRRVVSDRRSP